MAPTTDPSPDLEIVGLNSSTNDRSCCQHKICGEYVFVNDVLRLVRCIVTINGRAEEAIKLVKIADGSDTCTVAFVPWAFSSNPKVKNRVNKFVQVVEIYKNSDSTHKRRLANQNHGMASVVFMDEIPVNE